MIATRADWQTKPMPAQTATLDLDGTITLDDHALIINGYVPQSTADKWFIFHENGTVYVHRAATGTCIFQLHLTQKSDHYIVAALTVNRDPAQYRSISNEYDLQLLAWLLDNLLLGRTTPFPQPPRLAKNHHQKHQQHVSGSAATSTTQPLITLDKINPRA